MEGLGWKERLNPHGAIPKSPRASEKLTDQAGLAQLPWTYGIWAFAVWFRPREGQSPTPICAHHLPPLLRGTRSLSSAGGEPTCLHWPSLHLLPTCALFVPHTPLHTLSILLGSTFAWNVPEWPATSSRKPSCTTQREAVIFLPPCLSRKLIKCSFRGFPGSSNYPLPHPLVLSAVIHHHLGPLLPLYLLKVTPSAGYFHARTRVLPII